MVVLAGASYVLCLRDAVQFESRVYYGLDRCFQDLQDGRSVEALDRAARVQQDDPGNVDALKLAALAHRDLGQHDESVALLQRVVETRPTDRSARFLLGQSLGWAGSHAEAIAILENLSREDPGFHLATRELAERHMALGDYESADRLFRLLAERDPGSTGDRLAAAWASRQAGLERGLSGPWLARSALTYLAIREADPLDKRAAVGLAELYEISGDISGAAQLLTEAASIDPRDGLLWLKLGDLEARTGRQEAAKRSYRRASALADTETAGLRRLAGLYADAGRLGDAVSLLEEASWEESPGVHLDLGWIYYRAAQEQGRREYLRLALSEFDRVLAAEM